MSNVSKDFEELINGCNHQELISMISAYIHEDRLRDLLRSEITEEDKEDVIFSNQ